MGLTQVLEFLCKRRALSSSTGGEAFEQIETVYSSVELWERDFLIWTFYLQSHDIMNRRF